MEKNVSKQDSNKFEKRKRGRYKFVAKNRFISSLSLMLFHTANLRITRKEERHD